jgi:hypothetical protein
MTIRSRIANIHTFLRSRTKKQYLLTAAGLVVLFYGLNFLIPRQVSFSYAGQTCRNQLTVLPGLQRAQDDAYEVSFGHIWEVGSVQLTAMETCFKAKRAPTEGGRIVGTAPFDGPIARTLYLVEVGKAPSANVSAAKRDVPSTKPFLIPLSEGDKVHDYALKVSDKKTECMPTEASLACDLPSLKLEQDKKFDYELTRSFNGGTSKTAAKGSFKTLKAVTVTDGTVKNDQTVYSRPTELAFVADKPIAKASVSLASDDVEVPLETVLDGAKLTLKLKNELPREKVYSLRINKLEALDGSDLVEPYALKFSTSGGPQVASVSVGGSGVAQSAAIVLTFDQPLSKTKDITQFIALGGGSGSVKKRSDTQVVVQLNSLPLCQPFAITVKKGIPSEHDLGSGKDWVFNSRTTCYQAFSYGTSVKGRALTAYMFGASGPVTMFVGGIHGNEPSSTTLMRSWINQLEASPARYAGKRILVVPAINPDGLAAGTRANARGVNLNRNFPTDTWTRSIKDTDGNHPDGGGEKPLSEPEALALANLSKQYRPRLMLSFHAIGSLVVGDPGGYSEAYAAKYASIVGYKNSTSNGAADFNYEITGTYEDWTYRYAGIPSMVLELSSYTSVTNANAHYRALWSMLD